MRATDLSGHVKGNLTVLGDSGKRSGGSILWRCRCTCGREILLPRSRLLYGSVTDCGCISAGKPRARKTEDLTGQVFGELKVVRRAGNGNSGNSIWLCQCSCGQTREVPARNLKNGHTRSCGCQRYGTFHGQDLTGQRFGRLEALYPVKREKKGVTTSALWHCRCNCGRETDVYASSLMKGLTRSCGCLNQERRLEMHDHMHYMENTCVERLVRAKNTEGTNKAGFRGLFQMKSGQYRVMITFQKVHYYLGMFSTFEEAVKARLDAEDILHDGFLRAWQQWQEKAEADPAWAAENAFFFEAKRVNNQFQIRTNEGISV